MLSAAVAGSALLLGGCSSPDVVNHDDPGSTGLDWQCSTEMTDSLATGSPGINYDTLRKLSLEERASNIQASVGVAYSVLNEVIARGGDIADINVDGAYTIELRSDTQTAQVDLTLLYQYDVNEPPCALVGLTFGLEDDGNARHLRLGDIDIRHFAYPDGGVIVDPDTLALLTDEQLRKLAMAVDTVSVVLGYDPYSPASVPRDAVIEV